MRLAITKAIALVVMSLGPSFAHMLEAQPRLFVWSPELWRDATVFNAQFWCLRWPGLRSRFWRS